MLSKGHIVCSLRPCICEDGPSNPRNSEGAFLRTTDGRILFAYSRFEGDSPSDGAKAAIACIESCDEGQTWSEPRILFRPEDEKMQNLMSVSMLRMANGDIGIFYGCKITSNQDKYALRRSADEAKTWSEPVYCLDLPGYHVINNDRVVRLSSGRLVIPMAYHPPLKPDFEQLSYFGLARFLYSDDDGATWNVNASPIGLPTTHSSTGLQEPGIVELDGGVIWGYARTDLGRQYQFYSFDRGINWTPPNPSPFWSPNSPMHVKRNPYDGKLYVIWNPIPIYTGRELAPKTMGRTPYYMAVSEDNARNWSEPVILEDDPRRGFCYPAIHFEKDYLLLAYCAGGDDGITCLARTDIRRITY